MLHRSVTASLVLLSLFAQSIGQAHQSATDAKLNIQILEGDGAVNNIRQRVTREPIVEVTDENRKPVAGAAVVFLLPNQGAGGSFANGARSLTVLTDSKGQAVARGFQANRVAGQYQMRVTASSQGQSVSTVVNMSNLAAAGAAGAAGGLTAMKLLLIVGVAGGAAAAGAVVATRNGGGSTATRNPTTVTPGTPSVGAPQ